MIRKHLVALASTFILCSSFGIANAESITKEQGDAIINELRQIRQLMQRPQQAPQPAAKGDEAATVSISGLSVLGKVDAPLTMVLFTDYQCSFCSRFEAQTLPEIKKQYIDTGKLRLVVRDLPLSFHAHAAKAAEASHCAEEQGKYWEMHDKLMANSTKLDEKYLPDYAREVGLNLAKFTACMESGRQAAKVKANSDVAESVGISGTPGFILGRTRGDVVEGIKFIGAQPFAAFDQKLKELLAK